MPNFSNYNDSSSESCQDSSFREVYLLLLAKCNEPAKIRVNWLCFNLTILIVSPFSLYRLRITTQVRSGTVDKVAGIFTKRIWQPYIYMTKISMVPEKSFLLCCFSIALAAIAAYQRCDCNNADRLWQQRVSSLDA